MTVHIVDSLKDWGELGIGEVVEFDPRNGTRIKLKFNTTGPVEVWARQGDEETLIAADTGIFTVSFVIERLTEMIVSGDAGEKVFLKRPKEQRMRKSGKKVKFTSVEPKQRRNTEFDMMMQFVKMNERRRDQQLEQERNELRREREEIQRALQAQENPTVIEADADPQNAGTSADDTSQTDDQATADNTSGGGTDDG